MSGLASWRTQGPGLAVAAVVAIAALFLSEHYGASAMLFALLLGMALNFLGEEGKCAPGIRFSAKTVLRTGIALLGLRIALTDVAALGWAVTAMVAAAVAATIVFGALFARTTRTTRDFGVLTGGAVAICGASAALAVSAVLPRHAHAERDTTFAVIGVTTLSTVAMVLYPILSTALGFSPRDAGVFLGATIHDVAQVVGAGYSMSKETGDVATIVKLLRVAMLLPVILVLSLLYRHATAAAAGGERPPLLPWFAVAFGLLVLLNSFVALPPALTRAAGEVSRFFLVMAIAAIGMKTQLKELAVLGWRPVALIVAETLFLALLVVTAMHLMARG